MSIRPPSVGVTSTDIGTLIDDRVQGGTDTNVATLLAGGAPTADCWYFGPLAGSGSVGEQVVFAAYDHSQLRYQAYVFSSNGRSWFVADNAPVIETDGDVKQPGAAGTLCGWMADATSDEAFEVYAQGVLVASFDGFIGPAFRSADNTTRLEISNTGISVNGAATVSGALDHDGSTAGFYGTAPAAKPTVTGSRGGNAALASLLTGLASIGLITDSSSA